MSRRLLIINNVPTPYRTFMFNTMSRVGQDFDVEVRVAYQAERLSYRPWSPDYQDMRFPHFTSSGVNPFRRRPLPLFRYRTFNTDILRQVASGQYDWVMLAPLLSVGAWATALIPAGKTRKLLWSESNLTSSRFRSGPVRRFKGMLEAPFSALVCPGRRAVDYVLHLNPSLADRPVLWLPNVVDVSVYRDMVQSLRTDRDRIRTDLGVGPTQMLIVGAGQMVERKGYGALIEAAKGVPGDWRLILLGDGPLRPEWTRLAQRLGLGDQILLPGAADVTEVTRHLVAADWFIHPASQDPSPLVVVEAATAGLPLAVSTQTGNAPEAILEGSNGSTFDASDITSINAALRRIIATSSDERASMGARSSAIADDRFDPDTVVGRFFRDLLEAAA